MSNYKKITEQEAEELYSNMLDEVYGTINICGYNYIASHGLKEIDPIAYQTGMNDWLDSEELEVSDDADDYPQHEDDK